MTHGPLRSSDSAYASSDFLWIVYQMIKDQGTKIELLLVKKTKNYTT
jgi:hypothetical protein